MKNALSFNLSKLLPFAAIFALTACINPVVIGGNGDGGGGNGGNPGTGGGTTGMPCMTDAECPNGQACVNGVCSNNNPMTCNGVPSPLSCTQTGCASGQICVMDPDPSHCYPSACGCDATTGQWLCTADCGQGSHCVNPQPCSANGACPPDMTCDASGNCVPVCMNAPEICNAVDDDCDGQIDEQDDPAHPLCPDGSACVMGQCGGTTTICMTDADCGMNGVCINGMCTGTTCSPEVCNGIDDDCNGIVDDGAGAFCADGTICTNGQCGGAPQPCGPNTMPCPMGQVCTAMGVCAPVGCTPKVETCNGLDDDCDGLIDEQDDPTVLLCANGATCVNGQCGGTMQQCGPNLPCPMGQSCTAMGVCVTTGCTPKPEVCNGLDDDCDGVIDNAVPGTTLCTNGICSGGQCKVPCTSNADCTNGLCTNGVCN